MKDTGDCSAIRVVTVTVRRQDELSRHAGWSVCLHGYILDGNSARRSIEDGLHLGRHCNSDGVADADFIATHLHQSFGDLHMHVSGK